MNVRELDRPLCFGDAKQIEVLGLIGAGWEPCIQCGELIAPEDARRHAEDWAPDYEGLCVFCALKAEGLL